MKKLLAGMEAYAPRTKKVMLEGCSHWAQQDAVEGVLREARAWLAEGGARGEKGGEE